MVDESGSKALEQVFRFDIDEFDLVGVVEDAVGDRSLTTIPVMDATMSFKLSICWTFTVV